jgi:hypothetical protein
MPSRSFADVYYDGPPPSIHATRQGSKSTHPTSVDHIPADAPAIDFRRMSSSKAGMGRTRGTERSSVPKEAPIGSEFAERTRHSSMGGISNGSASPPLGSSPANTKKSFFGGRRGSSGSPRTSTADELSPTATTSNAPVAVPADPATPETNVAGEPTRERRGSLGNFLKKVLPG